MVTIEVQEYGSDERRFIFVDDDDFAKGTYDEEGNFIVKENGEYEAFYDDGWHNDQDFDAFNVIEDYKELDRDLDFYGTGYDRVKAIVDNEEVYLMASRWSNGNRQKGYVFKDWV